jgi:ribose-phosphate pyrophosphokinase
MIKINGQKIDVGHFPDKTQMLLNVDLENPYKFKIVWTYECDEELLTLIYLKRHIDTHYKGIGCDLYMPYVPNGRMDRVKKHSEVFTLKYFCEVINGLNFEAVYVLDPHSYVTEALINNIKVMNVSLIIAKSIGSIKDDYGIDTVTVYFPDDGAMKRYKDIFDGDVEIIYGKKTRDWETGKITGLEVYDAKGDKIEGDSLKDRTILMIDDIISFGGTLAYSTDKLREHGAKNIFAYASHTENSVIDGERGTLLKRFFDGTFQGIYTTNSLFHLRTEHPMIKFIYVF